MTNLNFKKLNRFFAVMVFVLASFVLSLGFGVSSFAQIAKAENENYYVINLSVSNATATLSYEGNAYEGDEDVLVKESDQKYLILKSVVDDTLNTCKVKVNVLANENFVLEQIVVNGSALSESDNGAFIIAPSTAETNVSVSCVAKTFTVKVSTSISADGSTFSSDDTLLTNNMGVSLDAISVSAHESVFDGSANVFASDRASDHLEFVGYFISDGINELDISSGRNIQTLEFDDEFISSFVKEDTLNIVAKYVYMKQVFVSVDSSCSGLGNFNVVAKNKNGDVVDFVSGEYYSVGTKISVLPTAEKYYKFFKYEYNGESIYDSVFSATVENADIAVKLFFEPQSYEIRFNIVNSVFERLGNEEIELNVTHIGSRFSTPVAEHVIIGDRIENFKFKNVFSYQDYRFVSWQLRSKTNDIVSISSSENEREVKNLEITAEFVDKYVVDGKIDFYGVFVQNCKLSILVDNVVGSGNIQVYEDGLLVEDLSKSFDYGTVLVVNMPNIEYMVFAGFDGLSVDDQYTPGQTTARICMNGNRSIAGRYNYVETELKVSSDSFVKNGRLFLSSDKVKIGDTFIINACLGDGYKIKSFSVNGVDAEQFVKNLNTLDGNAVAVFGDNGIITIRVTKNVYEFFASNENLSIKVNTKINGLYVALFVVYLLLALGFGAVIIVLSIKANNYSEEIGKLKKQQQDAVLKKEEEQRKEEEKQQALLEKQKEELKQETVSEKPKKTTAKKKVAEPLAEEKVAKKPKTASKTTTKSGDKPKTQTKKTTASKPKTSASSGEKPVAKKRTTKPKETKNEGGNA